jgi:hypothetical protein
LPAVCALFRLPFRIARGSGGLAGANCETVVSTDPTKAMCSCPTLPSQALTSAALSRFKPSLFDHGDDGFYASPPEL